MNNQTKQILIWIAVFIGIALIFQAIQGDNFSGNKNTLAFSEFLTKVESNEVSSAKIQGRIIEGTLRDGTNYTTYTTDYPELIHKLQESGAYIDVRPLETKLNSVFSIFVYWFPTLLIIGVWLFVMRQLQGGGKAMGLGKSKAKLLSADSKAQKVTFKDVAGINEAKEELTEIVEFLRDPGKFQKLGGKIPKGCLLIGPPGTGKTLLARAIAGEANVPFFSISGSDFVEMFVGVGASRVRDMFEQGKRNAPCIIFIDEIDAVGRQRGKSWGGSHDEREQTLNQMLVEMDGFEANEGVVIIAATNRPDVLDTALTRPGRFDRQINVSNPDIKGREEILKVHARKIKHAASLDVKVIARGTPGFSGADLANLVNEAALLAARKNKKEVELSDLEDAKDKVLMGVEHRSRVMSDEEKKLTAYHEAGHALVGIFCGDASHPIHKATIIPRGKSLGMVQRLPEADQYSETLAQMEAHIAVAMGGRVAEEIIFGNQKVTSGASMDIKSATYVADAMVKKWGLSPLVGPVYHGGNSEEESFFPGMNGASNQSEHTSQIIDKEIKRIIDEGYNRAKSILTEHIDQLHIVANALLEYETLTGQQIKNLINNKDIDFTDGESFKSSEDLSKPKAIKADGIKKEKPPQIVPEGG